MRVLLFGVDGLTFRVLDPYMERGLLPNFQRLQQGGARAVLKSTVPPMTPPAWMSIATGLSPAKHGVYDFWEYEMSEHGPVARVVTHRKGGKALWNLLSDWGKQVIVANVPLTYPPEPVNGIMLSGYMAPDMRATVTYPQSFKAEMLEAVPGYLIEMDPAISGGQIGDLLAETLKMTRERIKMFRLALEKPWDFLFMVFVGADRIQHLRWDEIMAFHPQAVEYYQMLDQALGMALDALQADDLFMLVSDHGFQGVRRKFYIHEYLYRRGFLEMRSGGNRWRTRALASARQVILTLRLQRLARLVRGQLRQAGVIDVVKEHHAAYLPDLDWRNTHAWLPSSSGFIAGYADIFLDDTLSEEAIQQLMIDLKELRDPDTSLPLITEMYREQAFGEGAFAPGVRHLIVLSGENTTLPTELGRRALWETSDVTAGIHHPDGVLYAYGAGVKRETVIAPKQVYDVAPTILAFMGVPLPGDLDGKAITDMYNDERFASDKLDRGEREGVVKMKLKKLASQGVPAAQS